MIDDPNSSVADGIFYAQRLMGDAEDVFVDRLETIFPGMEYERAVYDYYDRSFVLYGVDPMPDASEDQLKLIGRLGFNQFWLYKAMTNERSARNRKFYRTVVG